MTDFDAFESAPQENQAPQEEDPAAAFLAREQTELAGLEDDNFGADSSAQQPQGDFDLFGGDQAPVSDVQENQNADFFDDGGTAQDDTFGEPSEPMTNGPSDAYAAISHVDRLRQEPEKIRIWREEQQKLIQEKDAAEEERKDEWRDIARKELDDWYKHHDEQLTKTKENNREAEAAFVKDRDETEPGEEWEKICRLCEFNPKNSKNTKDISRMRSILLQLKQTPLVR